MLRYITVFNGFGNKIIKHPILMSKYLILGLSAALVTVLLIIGVGLLGLKAVTFSLEKKVKIIHLQEDIQTLQNDLNQVDTLIEPCKVVLTEIKQLDSLMDKSEFTQKELLQARIKIANAAEKAAVCFKKNALSFKNGDGGVLIKTRLAALGNSVFIAGRQTGYQFTEEEQSVLQSIKDIEIDQLGKAFIIDQVAIIVPALDLMLLNINQMLVKITDQP